MSKFNPAPIQKWPNLSALYNNGQNLTPYTKNGRNLAPAIQHNPKFDRPYINNFDPLYKTILTPRPYNKMAFSRPTKIVFLRLPK